MRIRDKLSRTLIVGSVILLAVVVIALLLRAFPGIRAHHTHEDTRSLYYGKAGNSLSTWLFPTASAEEALTVQEDFLKLYEANKDVVGWLKAGERIDDPVVQRDNDYYLTHNFYGKSDSNGTLFLNINNALIPRDDVLLIHGHNMRSGAMFGTLLKYMNYEYMCQNPLISFRTIYDAEDVYYTPIAAFNASMIPGNAEYFDITQIVFEDDLPDVPEEAGRRSKDYQAYLEALEERTIWKPLVDTTVEDRLLMLVTCSYFQEDGRFVLVCRELRENEDPESLAVLYSSAQ